MQNPYSEDELIEQPTINLLAEMGWEMLNCYSEFDRGNRLPRQTNKIRSCPNRSSSTRAKTPQSQCVPRNNRQSNRGAHPLPFPDEQWRSQPRHLYPSKRRGPGRPLAIQMVQASPLKYFRSSTGKHPENNDFFAASQFSITGEMYTKRPDIVCFVNGIPLVLMEFKRIDVNLYAAYNDNLRDYKDTIPHLFWYNAFILLSNGTDSKVGSLTTSWEHFAEWTRVHSEDEPSSVSLETILQALCKPERLLDVVENFILFMEVQGGLIKILGKNHQYLGVNNTIASLNQIEDNHGKLGVFWHTQGSGKSISMLFLAQKVLRKVPGNWTFVVVTDRRELDNQTYKTFASTSGVLTQQEVHAENVLHLRQLLR